MSKNTLNKPRPELEVYKYAKPGEMNVPQEYLEIFNISDKSKIDVEVKKYIDQTISLHLTQKNSDVDIPEEKEEIDNDIPKDTTEEVGVNVTESSGDADSGV